MNLNYRHVAIDDLTPEQIEMVKKHLYYEDYEYEDDEDYEYPGEWNFYWESTLAWENFAHMVDDVAERLNPHLNFDGFECEDYIDELNDIIASDRDELCESVRGYEMTEQQIINDYSKAVNELIFKNTATETACTVMQKYVANRFSEIKLTDLKHIAQAIQIMPDETRQALEEVIIEKLGTGGLFALKRTERKLSCLELAEQLGIARNFIVRFENECHPQFSRPRSVEQVLKMADFLEIPSKNLVFREGGLYYIEIDTCENSQNTEGE